MMLSMNQLRTIRDWLEVKHKVLLEKKFSLENSLVETKASLNSLEADIKDIEDSIEEEGINIRT